VQELLAAVEGAGGTRAIETLIQKLFRTRPTSYQRAVESGERIVWGSSFSGRRIRVRRRHFRVDPQMERAQGNVAGSARRRSASAVGERLVGVGASGSDGSNLTGDRSRPRARM